MRNRVTALALAAAAMLALPACAEYAVNDLSLGEHWYGSPVSVEELAGRVVLVEFWGQHCGPCIGSIPGLVKLADEYRDKGLVVIGCHSQAGTKEEVSLVCKNLGVNYPIFASGKVGDANFSGIPHAFVFDASGKCIHDGGVPSHGMIEEAIAKAPDFVLGANDYEELRKEAQSVIARKSLGKTLATLREAKSGSDAKATEAARMFERVDRYAQSQWAQVEYLKANRPSALMDELRKFSATWKDDEMGAKADAEIDALKGDDSFKASAEADAILVQIEAQLDEAKPAKFGTPVDFTDPDCQKKNAKIIKAVSGMAASLLKKYPETPAAKTVAELLQAKGIH